MADLSEFQAGPRIKFTRGDDFMVIRRLTGMPDGQGLLEAWWTVKDASVVSVPGDTSAVVQKHITSTDSDDGLIFLEADPQGNVVPVCKFVLTQAETLAHDAGENTYVWDLQGRSTAGHIGTMECGMLTVREQVTQAS